MPPTVIARDRKPCSTQSSFSLWLLTSSLPSTRLETQDRPDVKAWDDFIYFFHRQHFAMAIKVSQRPDVNVIQASRWERTAVNQSDPIASNHKQDCCEIKD
ncbi:hypothetical protein TELCIR_17407 [Teladorsagia circumcincta]|uniref:Uncharacterized protein n=1 Tax=Teladorsagia circumcincta TaxID=45464 RepID=A0A2G9TSV3_TELCI|nr:hypothetical protein TELCIR_17407 [Teladorsagia circumcincta]